MAANKPAAKRPVETPSFSHKVGNGKSVRGVTLRGTNYLLVCDIEEVFGRAFVRNYLSSSCSKRVVSVDNLTLGRNLVPVSAFDKGVLRCSKAAERSKPSVKARVATSSKKSPTKRPSASKSPSKKVSSRTSTPKTPKALKAPMAEGTKVLVTATATVPVASYTEKSKEFYGHINAIRDSIVSRILGKTDETFRSANDCIRQGVHLLVYRAWEQNYTNELQEEVSSIVKAYRKSQKSGGTTPYFRFVYDAGLADELISFAKSFV